MRDYLKITEGRTLRVIYTNVYLMGYTPIMEEEFQTLLTKCDAAIIYTPLNEEMDFAHFLTVPLKCMTVPSTKDADPFVWAQMCAQELKDTVPYILIPGKKFDTTGTRHGRGGGWYDRFLSKIPHHFVRIGVAHVSQVSSEALTREAWDEPMDWVLISDGNSWKVHKTSARN